jgi:tetratricopeptide (TPR) repeat protein
LYLDGRAAYRRGDSRKAVDYYARALEIDTSFSLAALELVSTEERVLQWAWEGSVHGIPFGRTMGETGMEAAWRRATDIAWRERARLNARDRTYLTALLGSHYPDQSSARERLADWERVTATSPDRADGWYRLAQVLLYQGVSLGLVDWGDRARAAYHRALTLDSTFVQPIAGLLEVAAREGDTAEVRRLAGQYLARDSLGPTAEYVRWHAAAVSNEAAVLEPIRARFDSLPIETLDRIQWTSQVEGIALPDADSALAVILRRSAGLEERSGALLALTMLRLNQGRPREAMRFWKRNADYLPDAYLHRAVMYAIYWEGDSALAVATIGLHPTPGWWMAQWRLWHGDTTGSAAAVTSLRRQANDSRLPYAGQAIYLDAMRGQVARDPTAAGQLQRADSVTLTGCCSQPHHGDLIVARLHEMVGDLPAALEATRRQQAWYPPEYLSTALEEEGRLAALTGDTLGAVRAYRHYLALRTKPELERVGEVERVKNELARLSQTH